MPRDARLVAQLNQKFDADWTTMQPPNNSIEYQVIAGSWLGRVGMGFCLIENNMMLNIRVEPLKNNELALLAHNPKWETSTDSLLHYSTVTDRREFHESLAVALRAIGMGVTETVIHFGLLRMFVEAAVSLTNPATLVLLQEEEALSAQIDVLRAKKPIQESATAEIQRLIHEISEIKKLRDQIVYAIFSAAIKGISFGTPAE